jgi:hypothetical protein
MKPLSIPILAATSCMATLGIAAAGWLRVDDYVGAAQIAADTMGREKKRRPTSSQ